MTTSVAIFLSQRLLLVSSTLLELCAYHDKTSPAAEGKAPSLAPATPPELTTREALVGNAERANFGVCPDGNYGPVKILTLSDLH